MWPTLQHLKHLNPVVTNSPAGLVTIFLVTGTGSVFDLEIVGTTSSRSFSAVTASGTAVPKENNRRMDVGLSETWR
jgi:hypothetical protein